MCENGSFILCDEGSSNGTFVNGMSIVRQPIAPGDLIEFGGSAFKFEA
jgi:pSer/pThr/pTyr-binding forkhead associated (FHA) protein